MKIDAVVFDIGGVLELTPSLGVTARWEEKLGLPAGHIDARLEPTWLAGAVGEMTEEQAGAEVTKVLGAHAGAFMDDVWTEYLGTPNTELMAYLGALRPRYRTGLVSNSFVGAREREQAAYGYAGLVDHIVYSHEAGVRKPDPRIYLTACDALGADPAATVFLDDHEPYVEGARAAGLHAVRFTSNAQAIAELDALLGLSRPSAPPAGPDGRP
ncbi:HAD family hydrolase [Nonomuraea sp. NPDC003560]|uniref:HAD family hydrolase n=1 Tax=Nonomuraea sp. NPDC003560 TaxID=3364341 RepID=UPI0036BCFA4B